MARSVQAPDIRSQVDSTLNDADVLKVIGWLQLQHGDPLQAVTLFDALHALLPSDRRVALSLALALLRTGNPQTALDTLEHLSIETSSTDLMMDDLYPCHQLLRSQALAALGRLAEAARAMRIFIRQRRLLDGPERD
jgi:predicted Zn-dependent protease